MKTYYILFVSSLLLLLASCSEGPLEQPTQSTEKTKENPEEKINGADLEMPNKELKAASLEGLISTNVNWIGVIPYGYTRKESTKVNYDYPFQ